MKVSKKTIMKWINALRSRKYKQTIYKLEDENGYCCLGVACDIFIKKDKILLNKEGFIKGSIPGYQENSPKWLKEINYDFSNRSQKLLLATLNDKGYYNSAEVFVQEKLNFDEIADVIQLVYIEGVFD